MMRKDNEELTHFALSISLIHQDNRDFGDKKRRDVIRESEHLDHIAPCK